MFKKVLDYHVYVYCKVFDIADDFGRQSVLFVYKNSAVNSIINTKLRLEGLSSGQQTLSISDVNTASKSN